MGIFDKLFKNKKDIDKKNIEETPPILKFNNETLRAAVKEWLEDYKKAEASYGNISNWDTSEITDMSKLFLDAHTFNEPLNNWDVSNVTNMHAMFDNAYVFNQPLNSWDVSKVTNMREMFSSAETLAFNQPLDNWDVSKVTDMSYMFKDAISFNQPLNNWDVSNVTDMSCMFYKATSFNQPLNNWDVSSVIDMKGMFGGAEAFNQPIGNWNVSNVIDMRAMFKDANTFNQSLDNWNLTFQANLDMGDVKRIQKEYQAAITYYKKAIEIEPKNALGYKKRAEVKQFTENFKGAVADLTKAIELNPNNPDSYELRGLFKEELREFEGAILDYKKAIELEHDTKKIDLYNFNIKTVILKMEGKDEIEILREQLIKKGIDPDAQMDSKEIAALLNTTKKAMDAINEQLTDIERSELHNNLKDRKTDKTNNLMEEDAKSQIDEKIVEQDYYIKNEFFKEIAEREEIKVNWLQDIGPIYPFDAYLPHVLLQNPVTENDCEYICLFCNNKTEAIDIIDHIISLNGGIDKFLKHEQEKDMSHRFSGHLFNIGYRNKLSQQNHVIVELNRREERKVVSFNNDKSEILYGIHKDSKKINSIIKGLNSIVYNSGEMTSGGGHLYFDSSGSHIVSYWSDIKKAVEQFKSIVDCYPENAINKDWMGSETEIKDFSYKNLLKILNKGNFIIEFKTDDFKINLSQGNSSFQMNIYIDEDGTAFIQ